MIGAIIGGVVGGLNMFGTYMAQREEEEKQRRIIALQKRAARMKDASIQNSAKLMGMLSYEATQNAAVE